MRSKTSFFSISGAVVREDFRKYWMLPVLFSIGFFLSGIFVLLMQDNDEYMYGNFIHTILTGQYFPYTILLGLMPLVATVMCFSYLNTMGSVLAVHSQPLTRNTLINSHAAASLLLSLIPLIVNGAILMIMAHPTYYPENYYSPDEQMFDLFTRMEVIRWFLESILCVLFVLAICIFARIITGTGVHNVIAAIGFNIVVPGVMLLFALLGYTYLYGFSTDSFFRGVARTTPLFFAYVDNHFSALACVVYLLIAAAVYAVSMHLYNVRKLERTTQGVVFGAFNYIITLIFTFAGMTLLGMLFYYTFGSMQSRLIGYLAGAALGFVVCRIIIEKTMKLAAGKSLKMFAACLVVCALLIGTVSVDILGYENKAMDDADMITISGLDTGFIYGPYRDSIRLEGDDVQLGRDLHQYIIDNKKEFEGIVRVVNTSMEYDVFSEELQHVQIRYFKNNKSFSREYRVPMSALLTDCDEFAALMESDPFRNGYMSSIPAFESWNNVQICDSAQDILVSDGMTATVTDKAAMKSLHDAYVSDMKTANIRDNLTVMFNKSGCGNLNVEFQLPGRSDVNAWDVCNLPVYSCFTNTISWLTEHGYEGAVQSCGAGCSAAAVFEIPEGDEGATVIDLNDRELEGETFTVESIADLEGLVKTETEPELMGKLYDKSFDFRLSGKHVSTKQDDLYLTVFFDKEGYIQFMGYIYGKDMK